MLWGQRILLSFLRKYLPAIFASEQVWRIKQNGFRIINPKIVFNEKALSLGAAVYAKSCNGLGKKITKRTRKNQRITVVSSKL